VAIGVVSVIAGLAAARIWGLAPSGMIVLIAAGIFGVVAVAKRGVAPRLRAEGSRP
jgi:ABC-type Mn2+/Zn2+ transport system permease subunit